MSECVVRMEMPVDKRCPFDFNLPKMGPWCWIEDRECDYYKTNNRPDWCPIICQLPEGHGDLVEAKEITVNVKIKGKKCSADVYATTIVPAERSET